MSLRDALGRSPSQKGAPGPVAAPARPRSPWIIFATVSLALMMAAIDQTIVSTALHSIDHSLHTTVAWGAWTITAYQLGTIMAQPVMGRISDQFGRKRVFLYCVVVFTTASLLCGLSTSIYVLLPLRMIQAIGGGGFMPSATGIVSDAFAENRDRGIGLFTSIFPLGSMSGPIFGGIIVTYWSWRGIFFINVPIGILLFVLASRIIPYSAPRESNRRPDLAGIALLAAFTGSMMAAITLFGTASGSLLDGLLSPAFLLAATAFVVFLVLFIRHLKRTPSPIIPIALFRQRAFATMNLMNFVYGGCVVGLGALVPLYAYLRYGIPSLQAGTLLTARSAGGVLVAGATSFALRRIGYRLPMALGFGTAVVGLFLLASGPPGISAYAWLAIGAAFMGIGNGMAAPATNNAVLAFAPDDVAAISGVRGSFRQLGGIVAISVTSALVTRNPVNPGMTLAHCFVAFGLLILAISPLILTVPERRADW